MHSALEREMPMHDVFMSYAHEDADRAQTIMRALESVGLRVWRDRERLRGGVCFGEEIALAIRSSKVVLLLCSPASMCSRAVRQEIMLAWKHQLALVPALLNRVPFPYQVEYWLEGVQWVEILDHPEQVWLPAVIESLRHWLGFSPPEASTTPHRLVHAPKRPTPDLQRESSIQRLRAAVGYSPCLWAFDPRRIDESRVERTRDLGAVQPGVVHVVAQGSSVGIGFTADRDGHLLLLDEGPSGVIYRLCPSLFAPDSHVKAGVTYRYPQPCSPHPAFQVTGRPGIEHLLAIVTDGPPIDPNALSPQGAPALAVDHVLIERLLSELPPDNFTAHATFFTVVSAEST